MVLTQAYILCRDTLVKGWGTHKNVSSDRPAKVPSAIVVMLFSSRSLKADMINGARVGDGEPPAPGWYQHTDDRMEVNRVDV